MRTRFRRHAIAIAALAVTAGLTSIASPSAYAADTELNIYNWSEYIAKDTVPNFEKLTGIKVHYDSYDSDDTLQTKLLAGSSGYDIVVPTSNFMARQIQAGVYQKLDKSKIPNLVNLDPALMSKVADGDPGNQYGVPWAWGTDGLGYNVQAVKKRLGENAPLDSWALLFDPANVSKLKGCGVSMLDAPDDAFGAAMQYLGLDENSKNPADYQAAYEALKKIRPYITQFNSTAYADDLANNDVCLALGWSGDVGLARRRTIDAKRSYEIRFSNPKEGGAVWFDVMVVPKDAPHPEAAMKWINYIQDPKVNAAITNEIYYPTANKPARALVNPAIAQDPNVYLPDDVLRKMTLAKAHTPEISRLLNRLWLQLKSGG
ncbi:Putrescine-binding periplasmic protein SpuD [Paraburkholderia domus]|jgi:Spermidine/putrescine-binding periplasmic protein|uniref:Putrescine-binding periplasmic protein n=1 Tax=Paraburkholderia domus TaxID=2793075 RepID=A0A9N8N4J8_9BURK|nr:polyamine ABC transporter substrate-binding protein [Paraburkholderia domus]MBK5053126.1 polyamine ABC transporter substrate-binding protein [Burkholderia sp. R-70006]MBK5065083.1 polyamine ABC transporter substrate-binding protein [Burkholderia sp. R-70199]MBK5090257.1 polyamine ABC transporter substrate-binding protein [Burkholderia sp. R-69927]MBK5124754.1 polyamine ABC transporter substrate-binding protein [Burkholderia sp. R-69980]MBK5169004.1 polyamine ABC transporter substrate-bindin